MLTMWDESLILLSPPITLLHIWQLYMKLYIKGMIANGINEICITLLISNSSKNIWFDCITC